MNKVIDTLNNLLKLISNLVTLAMLGGFIYLGISAYRWCTEITSKPIQVPTMQWPEIKIEAPKINLSGLFGGGQSEAKPALPAAPYAGAGPVTPGWQNFCKHEPRCVAYGDHGVKNIVACAHLCDHSPACTTRDALQWRHYDDMYAACRHQPKCANSSAHWMQVWDKGQ